MDMREDRRRFLLQKLNSRSEELGKQGMVMLGCRLRIVGLRKEIERIKENLTCS